MANALTAAKHTATSRFYQALNAPTGASYMDITDALVIEDPSHTEADIYGLVEYAAASADPTVRDLVASSQTTDLATWEEVAYLSNTDARNSPELVAQLAVKLANLGIETLTTAYFEALTTLDATAHPESGGSVYAAQGGGTVYFCDAFTISPPTGSNFNQQNLYTDALDTDALSAALAARHSYKSKSGTRYHAPGKPMLVVPGALETTANDLHTTGAMYDGTGVRPTMSGRLDKVVVFPGGTEADSNDWFLIWRELFVDQRGNTRFIAPVYPLLRTTPTITFENATKAHGFYIKAEMEFAIAYSVSEANIQMHKVA